MDGDENSYNKSKKGGNAMAGSPATRMIAVKEIKTHPAFENLLRIDEEDQERLTRKMGEEGFYESEVVVLASWEGLEEEGPVMVDGHRRWRAAVANGIEEIPCVILEFADMMAALQRAISLQMERRPSKDGTLYRLCERFDTLMQRGRPRKGEEGNKLLPHGNLFSGSSPSARVTAELIGCNYRKVDKIRKIRRDGTPEIQEAVRNDVIGIEKAYQTIRKMELGTDEIKRNPAKHMTAAKTLFTEENLASLKELGGDLHSHANAAIEDYVVRLYNEEMEEDT